MTIVVEAVYEGGILRPSKPVDLPDKTEVQITIETRQGPARTALGGQLRSLRAQILESGAPALDWDGVEAEVAARRGGFREGR